MQYNNCCIIITCSVHLHQKLAQEELVRRWEDYVSVTVTSLTRKLQLKYGCILLDSILWCLSVPVRVPAALYWAKEYLARSPIDRTQCIYSVLILIMIAMWKNINYAQYEKRTDGDINWTEHESSLKHHVHSNVKHKTKENAPGQTAAQVKSE